MPHRLIADAMLGRLARWLRALGHDVVFDERLDDPALARLARAESRVLLTRDRRLCSERGSPSWCMVLGAEKPRHQLLEIDGSLPIFSPGWRERLFTRCMVCNTPLVTLAAAEARSRLPRSVRHDRALLAAGVRSCPGCGRVYWAGSHARRMRRWLEATASRSR